MSQGNCETEVFLCRLCGTENGVLINIFESSPNNECIRKIEAVVPDVVVSSVCSARTPLFFK